MRLNKTFLLILLALIVFSTLVLAILLPSKTKVGALDIIITDKNDNFQLEKNEKLKFEISDTTVFKDPKILWEFGNGVAKENKNVVNYTYKKQGEYLVTLTINDIHEINKKIKIISVDRNTAIDSVPKIYGPHRGYVKEEMVFLNNTPGVKSWYWEFGETGTVDAYDSQVRYSYKTPGQYIVTLNTDQSKYPIYHKIEILPLFNEITTEEIDSLTIIANDIKEKFQNIANASVSQTRTYYKNLRYIEQNYKCEQEDMVVIVNNKKYNDLYSYCHGLHYLGGKGAKSIIINEVKVDTVSCNNTLSVTKVNVIQNTISQ